MNSDTLKEIERRLREKAPGFSERQTVFELTAKNTSGGIAHHSEQCRWYCVCNCPRPLHPNRS